MAATMPRSRFPMSEREKAEARIAAAIVNGGAAAAEPRGEGLFTVTGRSGSRYTVRVFTLDSMLCDCEAAVKGKSPYCWHRAAVYLRLIAESTVAA